MKIKPRNEHVVVRRIPSREKSSGIIIPGQETERDLFAVTAVGPGGFTPAGTRAPIELDVGQPIVPGMLVFVRPGDYEMFDSDPNSPGDESLRMVIPQSAIIGVEVDDNDQPLMFAEPAQSMIATLN